MSLFSYKELVVSSIKELQALGLSYHQAKDLLFKGVIQIKMNNLLPEAKESFISKLKENKSLKVETVNNLVTITLY